VALRFLSQEWADALTGTLNASEDFRRALAGQNATLQQVITTGDDDVRYWMRIVDGTLSMGIGEADNADATITESYDTAVALARRELSPVTGFMMGRIKVDGNMGMLLGLQGALGQLADAMSAMDVDYSAP
jgi:putative sterol carrier protein